MAKHEYVVRGYVAHADVDNFENGCSLVGSKTEWSQEVFKSDTLTGLIALLCKEFKGDVKHVESNACDELGRIDIQVNQREAFTRNAPSENTMKAWRNGEINLWLTNYSFYVVRETVELNLSDILKSEKEMTK